MVRHHGEYHARNYIIARTNSHRVRGEARITRLNLQHHQRRSSAQREPAQANRPLPLLAAAVALVNGVSVEAEDTLVQLAVKREAPARCRISGTRSAYSER